MALAPAASASGTACSDTANVGWSVDHETVTVAGAHVQVPGCADGEWVGIELITTEGDVPSDGPLASEVVDQVANFDLSDLELRIEPVTGIRVYLEIAGEPTPIVAIDVDQRFFNPAGNEQIGRGLITTLILGVGQEYEVPSDYVGYEPADCSDLGVTAPDDLVAEGTGTFTANESGTHLACYQQQPGSGGGPGPGQPEADVPEVLGEIIDGSNEDVTTDGGVTPDDAPTTDQDEIDDEDEALIRVDDDRAGERDDEDSSLRALGELSRTGTDAVGTFLIGFLLVVSGGSLLRWRRRNTGTAPTTGP